MTVTIVADDVELADAERLRTFAEEALAELGADVDVPIHLADAYPGKPDTAGWASSASGVHIVADRLECADEGLRRLVFHEVAHWFAFQEFPDLQAPFGQEVFATFFAGRSEPNGWRLPGPGDHYGAGVLVGAALAGDDAARETAARRGLLQLVTCLDGIDEPRAFVTALLDHQGVPGPTGLRRPGCERCRRPPGP